MDDQMTIALHHATFSVFCLYACDIAHDNGFLSRSTDDATAVVAVSVLARMAVVAGSVRVP
jgi:hypothetical protein